MEFDVVRLFVMVGAGCFVGTAAGFLGIGGGAIMVPLLLEVFRAWGIPVGEVVHVAMGTSLLVGALSSASSAYRHHRQGNVLWRVVPWVVPTSFLSGLIASRYSTHIPGNYLQLFLSVVLLFVAYRLWFEKANREEKQRKLHGLVWAGIGIATGVVSGFSGLAGGVVLIPMLRYVAKVPTRHLAATSSSVIVFTALASATGRMFAQPAGELGAGFVGYVNLFVAMALAITAVPFAQFGAVLNKRVSPKVYRRAFGVLLIFIIGRLWVSLL